jgi:hypothetical protein
MQAILDVLRNPIFWVIAAAVCGLLAAILTTRQQREQRVDLEGWVTGGDSYAVLEPHQRPDGSVAYFLRHVGNYPLQHISVKVFQGGWPFLEHMEPVLTGSQDWRFVFAVPPPGPTAQPQEFRVEIAPLRGNVVQYLRLVPGQGRWLTNSRKVLRSDHADKPVPVPANFKPEELR